MGLAKVAVYTLGGLLGVTALAAGGAFVYLQNADLAPWVVSMAKDKAAMDITAEGPLTLKLLPHPVLHAQKLTVASFHGDKPLLKVDEADVQLAWGKGLTFWKGVQLTELRLTNPVVNLIKPKDGPANWQTVEAYQDAQEAKAEGDSADMPDGKLPFSSFGVIDVSNLNLTYVDEAAKRTVKAEGVNLTADGTDLAEAKLKIDGKINGQPLNGDAGFNFSDLKRVPLTANLTASTLKVALDGELRDQKAYAGAVNIQTPNLKEALASLMGTAPAQAPAEPFSVTGDVATGGENLALKNFNASLGSLLKATGDVDVTLGDSPSARGTFVAQGSNLRQLVTLATGQANAALPAQPFKISTKLAGQDAIQLTGLNAELDGLLAVDGDITLVPDKKPGGMPKVNGSLHARSPNAKALAEAFGSKASVPAQPLTASMDIAGKDTYKLTDVAAQLGTLGTLAGNLDVTPQPALKLVGDVAIQGNDLAAAAKAFGVAANLPRSSYSTSFKLGGDKRIELSDLVVKLPQLVEATGYMSMAPAAPYDVQGDLTFSRLNLNALGYCQPKANGGETATTASTAAPAASATPWSDEPLPLESLNTTTFKMAMHVKGLDCASFPATSAEIEATNSKSTLNVSKLNATMNNGGSIQSTLALDHGSSSKLSADVATTNLALHDLVRTLADKGVQLPLSGKANLTSQGRSTRALAQNLAGTIDFRADDGRVPYQRMLGNLSSISSLIQGQVPTQTSDKLRSMVAKYKVAGGVMTTEELKLVTDGMTLSGTGTINLPAWSIDYSLTPEVTVGDKISIPVLVQGSLGGPNIGPDKNFLSKLSGRLATEGLKGVLGIDKTDAKGLGGAVGDLLGGKGLKGEGVQNLLNNVLQPKQATQPAAEQPATTTDQSAPATEAAPAAEPAPAEQPAATNPTPEDLLNSVLGQ